MSTASVSRYFRSMANAPKSKLTQHQPFSVVMKKITRYFVLTLTLAAFGLQSCKREAAPGPEADLANKEWLTDGIFVNDVRTVSPNLKLQFRTGTINSLVINGITNPLATWQLRDNGRTLRIIYPEVTLAAGATTPTLGGAKTQDLRIVSLTASELRFQGPDGGEINLLGLIRLGTNSQYRMNLTGPTDNAAASQDDENLQRNGGWTGNDGTNNTGFFLINDQGVAARQGNANITLRFGKSPLGVNFVTAGGVPVPATWALTNNKTRLVISYPTYERDGQSVQGADQTLRVDQLNATQLWLSSESQTQFTLLGILNFAAGQQLRMAPPAN